MFDIRMLPADHGDCLWIEYGRRDGVSRILVDCGAGFSDSYPALCDGIRAFGAERASFELLVLTHVDRDHIAGAIKLLGDRALEVDFGEVWFNGWQHLRDFLQVGGQADRRYFSLDALGPQRFAGPRTPPGFLGGRREADGFLGARQGEIFTAQILGRIPWNESFGGRAVVHTREPVTLPGGMRLTVLSPTAEKLGNLCKTWRKEIAALARDKADPSLVPGNTAAFAATFLSGGREQASEDIDELAALKPSRDTSSANGSSIAVLAEYEDKRALLLGDAHPDVIESALDSLDDGLRDGAGGRIRLDAVKLAHHGSDANTTRELVERIDCPNWLVSTDGGYYGHPDRSALARVVRHAGGRPTLHFNHRTKHSAFWDDAERQAAHGYAAKYPEGDERGLVVRL